MDKLLRIQLANAEIVDEEEFKHAESGHACDPDIKGCQRFEDGVILNVRRAKDGSLILKLSDEKKPQ